MEKLNTVLSAEELSERQSYLVKTLDAKPVKLEIMPVMLSTFPIPGAEGGLIFFETDSSSQYLIFNGSMGMRISTSNCTSTGEEAVCLMVELFVNPLEKSLALAFQMGYVTKPNLGTFRYIVLGGGRETIEMASIPACREALRNILDFIDAVKRSLE